jgi:hypothetical protein
MVHQGVFNVSTLILLNARWKCVQVVCGCCVDDLYLREILLHLLFCKPYTLWLKMSTYFCIIVFNIMWVIDGKKKNAKS